MTQLSRSTTIAILGGNTVVGQALTLLLNGAGYDTKLIEAPPADLANELLNGIDALLLAPGLSTRARDTVLKAVRDNPKTKTTPVLTLSAVVGEALNNESDVNVPWPSSIEHLAQCIEAALTLAPSGKDRPCSETPQC